jgi:PAS domain S-box-containing protein
MRVSLTGKRSSSSRLKVGDRVTSVLATSCPADERESVVDRLQEMQPLFDQIALVIQHAYLYEKTVRNAARIEERQRLVQAMHEIGRSILSTSDIEEALDSLVLQVAQTGLFRSLTVALVDGDRQEATVVRQLWRRGYSLGDQQAEESFERTHLTTPLEESGIIGDVARSGETEIIQGWDDRYDIEATTAGDLRERQNYADKVAYFIPVKQDGRVLAVLATASSIADRQITEERIDAMDPLLDQVAVAIAHFNLVDQLSGEAKRLDTIVELQERENIALLEVNQLVQDVSNVEDLEKVIRGIVVILRNLGINFAGMTIQHVLDTETGLVESHHLRPDDIYRQWRRPVARTINEWRADRVLYWPDVVADSEGLEPGYYETAYRGYNLKVRSLITVPYAHGTITLRSTQIDAFTEDDRNLLRKIGNVLSVGVSRLHDLEALEQKRAEQEALVAISHSVLEMRRPQDVESVLGTFAGRLRGCNVRFDVLSYRLLRDEQKRTVESYEIGADLMFEHRVHPAPAVWDRWKQGEIRYNGQDDRDACGIYVRSTLHIPTGQGLITLLSSESSCYEVEIQKRIQRLSEPLSLGFARLDDLEQAERRTNEITTQGARVREEKEFSENLIASLREGFCILSPEGTLVEVNPALCQMTGFLREELIGSELPHPFWPSGQARRMRVLMLRAARGDLQDYEVSFLRKGGSSFPVVVSPAITQGTEHQAGAYFATIRDVSEQKQIQAERIQSQRLRVIGELSAGVSHNLNNILTSILGPAQLLEMKTQDPNLLKDIETIQVSATRAADLVKKLSWTTADRRQELGPVDLKMSIEQAIDASSPKWRDEVQARGSRVEIYTNLADTAPIRGTRAGLHDTLLNLIFNAVDAMPDGGQITIETEVDSKTVSLRVSDSGLGMSEATRIRVFEPFFTTKMDVGSGLGLSTLFGTIRGWGGSATVKSRPGDGAEFRLLFVPWDQLVPIAPPHDPPDPVRRSTGRILIVDDDLFVREFLLAALRPHHEVVVEEDANKGLSAFDKNTFDVAILDLGMPEITGDALARSIREKDKDIALIMITGWDLDKDDPRRKVFDFFLMKPFDSIGQIEKAIDEAIKLNQTRYKTDQP